jgi:hypothetical protein
MVLLTKSLMVNGKNMAFCATNVARRSPWQGFWSELVPRVLAVT